jgi:hypothetical protein
VRNKYNARKTTVDGIKFDSKAEATMYCELKILEKAGAVKDLKLQPEFELQPAFEDCAGHKTRAIKYRADFSFFDIEQDRYRVVDCKGFKTAVYKLKKKMFDYANKNIIWLEEHI